MKSKGSIRVGGTKIGEVQDIKFGPPLDVANLAQVEELISGGTAFTPITFSFPLRIEQLEVPGPSGVMKEPPMRLRAAVWLNMSVPYGPRWRARAVAQGIPRKVIRQVAAFRRWVKRP